MLQGPFQGPPPMSIEEMFRPLIEAFVFVNGFVYPFVLPYLPLLKVLALILSLLFIAGIFWTVFMLRDVNSKESAMYRAIDVEAQEARRRLTNWEVVRMHLDSQNPAEWKIAVLEADRILEGVLIEKGVQGDSLGEQLKGLTRRELLSINDAWEAHKVRNQIAHEGAAFALSHREAERAIALFEKTLHELDYF